MCIHQNKAHSSHLSLTWLMQIELLMKSATPNFGWKHDNLWFIELNDVARCVKLIFSCSCCVFLTVQHGLCSLLFKGLNEFRKHLNTHLWWVWLALQLHHEGSPSSAGINFQSVVCDVWRYWPDMAARADRPCKAPLWVELFPFDWARAQKAQHQLRTLHQPDKAQGD